MKKINDSTFDIEMTSIRELNPNEADQVGGGDHPPMYTNPMSVALSCLNFCEFPPTEQEK
ncbi:MAG: hypothetical protein L3J83_08545 [Proteobacteria bacterium]|nr:hypothetical protein [Pseudomonadota bacterium]